MVGSTTKLTCRNFSKVSSIVLLQSKFRSEWACENDSEWACVNDYRADCREIFAAMLRATGSAHLSKFSKTGPPSSVLCELIMEVTLTKELTFEKCYISHATRHGSAYLTVYTAFARNSQKPTVLCKMMIGLTFEKFDISRAACHRLCLCDSPDCLCFTTVCGLSLLCPYICMCTICMYACMHACMYVCMYVCIYVSTHVRTHKCMHAYV